VSKEKRLTNAEKEMIAYLYRKKLSIGKIAYVIGRHRRSVSRYKNYRVSTVKSIIKPQVKPKIEPEFKVEDQELFKRMYDDFVNYHWYENIPSNIFKQIRIKYWEKHNKKIKKWPTYKDMYKTDIIIDLRERLIRKYSNEGV